MNSVTMVALCIAGLYLGYRLYGGLLARLWDTDARRPTPAVEQFGGVDYVPAKH